MKYNHDEWNRNMKEAQDGIASILKGIDEMKANNKELIKLKEEATNYYDEMLSLINKLIGDEQ